MPASPSAQERSGLQLVLIPPRSIRVGEKEVKLGPIAYRAVRAAMAHAAGVAVVYFLDAVWDDCGNRPSRDALRHALHRLNVWLDKLGYPRRLSLEGGSIVWC